MKKIYSISGLLSFIISFSQVVLPPNISDNENYVFSRKYLEETATSSNSVKSIEAVSYFDGLGRPKQIVNIQSSPLGKDIVTPIVYDGFGRQVKDYLPIPQSSTTYGAIYTQNSQNPVPVPNPTSIYASGEKIYSEKVLENSPLDRIQQQIQVGNAWNSHPATFDYLTNTATDVKKYTTTTTWVDNATKSTLSYSTYAANTLYKNKITDEDGNISYEYKNGQGQTLLVRKMNGATPVDTYYVYNEYDQLAFVIPPLAAVKSTLSEADLNNLCYQYRYDGRNRLVEKRIPGKDWEYMVYDKQDRLIMTQDAHLKNLQLWLFTKYDKFGRVALTGLTRAIDNTNRITHQNNANTIGINNVERKNTVIISYSGLDLYYTVAGTYPLYNNISKLLSVNYYDTYPGDKPGTAVLSNFTQTFLSDNSQVNNVSTKGFPVASFVNNIESDKWTKSYSYYDTKGRIIGTYTRNSLGGFTLSESFLRFSGVPDKVVTKHSRNNFTIPSVTVEEKYVYDPQERLSEHYHEVIGKSPKILLSKNTYNEIGQLIEKKTGAYQDGSSPLQMIKYDYNIRGWMTGINSSDISNQAPYSLSADKLFGYRIKYNNPTNPSVAAGKYNGNISEVDWIYQGDVIKRYGYQYDGLNRLLNGVFQSPNETTQTVTNIYNESLEYDLNSNIIRLYRNAKHIKFNYAVQVDALTYTYQNGNGNSNRLQSVSDTATNSGGYRGTGQTITYDSNGNMKTFPDKGISQPIVYNYLNLPQTIIQNGKTTTYTYRADGVKLKKSFLINGETINTEYLDGFVYTTPYTAGLKAALTEDDASTVEASVAQQEEALVMEEKLVDPGNPELAPQLSFFATAEGFYDYENNRYIYQYKDHLGNVRLNYTRNSAGTLQKLDVNNYYPFGLNFIGDLSLSQIYHSSATFKNYKYNGKELQETGIYDYGARMYMPDAVIWGQFDPLAEVSRRFSPYAYAFNNPIRFIDPDGRTGQDWIKKDNKWTYDANITTAQQAKDAGADDFAKNGTIISNASVNGGEAGFVRLNAGGTADNLPNATAQDMLANNLVVLSQSLNQGISSFSSFVSSQFSGGWHSNFARGVVSDTYSVGLSSNVSAFLGIGTTPINFTLLTRGQPGLYFTPTVNAALGTGIEGNAGVTFGLGRYTGDSRQIQSSFLQGHSGGVSAGLGVVLDGSAGVSYAPVRASDPFGKQGGFINVSGQIGVGIQGSPVTGVNAQLNYQYTPIVKPIFQIK